MPDLTTESLPVRDLAAYAADYNPRVRMSEDMPDMFARLRSSLRTYGAVQPCVVNRRSPEAGWPDDVPPCIVAGHQRIEAAEAEGFDAFPVVWVDVNRSHEKALNLALNKIDGGWDEDRLSTILADLRDDDDFEDMSVTGFSDRELAKLVDGEELDVAGLSGVGGFASGTQFSGGSVEVVIALRGGLAEDADFKMKLERFLVAYDLSAKYRTK